MSNKLKTVIGIAGVELNADIEFGRDVVKLLYSGREDIYSYKELYVISSTIVGDILNLTISVNKYSYNSFLVRLDSNDVKVIVKILEGYVNEEDATCFECGAWLTEEFVNGSKCHLCGADLYVTLENLTFQENLLMVFKLADDAFSIKPEIFSKPFKAKMKVLNLKDKLQKQYENNLKGNYLVYALIVIVIMLSLSCIH